jgi:cation:H+ antiporter
VATGAILGAPFLLATLAMGLVGLSAYLWRRRRSQGVGLAVHFPTLERDLAFFMGCFGFAFLLGVIGVPEGLRMVAAVALVLAYVGYVRLTLNNCGEVEPEAELPPLLMDRTRGDPPTIGIVLVQSSSRSARLWGEPSSSSRRSSTRPRPLASSRSCSRS